MLPMKTLISRAKARRAAGISRATESRWLAHPEQNPLWPRPVPPVVPGATSPYVAEEVRSYIEARIAARDAAQAQAEPGRVQ